MNPCAKKPTPLELKKFGLTLGAALVLVPGLFFPYVLHRRTGYWPWYIAAVSILFSAVWPRGLFLIYTPLVKVGTNPRLVEHSYSIGPGLSVDFHAHKHDPPFVPMGSNAQEVG